MQALETIKAIDFNNQSLLFTYQTIFGCSNSFNSDISLIAVDGTPSSSLSNRIFFKATSAPVFLFFPLYTTPYVPEYNE